MTALILIIAAASSVSSLPYIGSPIPAGRPEAFTRIVAPTDKPFFLISPKYSSHTETIFLSGQKNELEPTEVQLKFLGLILKAPT